MIQKIQDCKNNQSQNFPIKLNVLHNWIILSFPKEYTDTLNRRLTQQDIDVYITYISAFKIVG
jgi:hypothetical protein